MVHNTELTPEDALDLPNVSVIFKGDYNRIFRYILSMVQDSRTAEDLTQETFLRAYRSRDSLLAKGADRKSVV